MLDKIIKEVARLKDDYKNREDYGEYLIIVRKWVFGWRFPFLQKKIVWSGTTIEAQDEVNRHRRKVLDHIWKNIEI